MVGFSNFSFARTRHSSRGTLRFAAGCRSISITTDDTTACGITKGSNISGYQVSHCSSGVCFTSALLRLAGSRFHSCFELVGWLLSPRVHSLNPANDFFSLWTFPPLIRFKINYRVTPPLRLSTFCTGARRNRDCCLSSSDYSWIGR